VRTFRIRRAAIATTALAIALLAAGCSGSDDGGGWAAPAAAEPAPASTPMASSEPFGPACSSVPAEGAGSFSGMATAPVATAASNNPVLSTLVTAVKEAGLVDTLNSTEDLTVFAPANDAFNAVPKATMDAAMKDPKGLLTQVLTGHVVAGKLAPDALAGEHKTLAGSTITVEGSGEDFTVNGNAKVVCGNVQTANATVYIIDNVLLPKS
jgi:uncharacterized surface protein with fasciclin (FAS1) repeats